MSNPNLQVVQSTGVISSEQLDLSSLVGRNITIFSEQFPGNSLQSRVVMVNDNRLSIDRGKNHGKIDELINNQNIITQFDYKGEKISVSAVLKRTTSGKCTIILGDNVVPLTRRKFKRFIYSDSAKFAVIASNITSPSFTSRLKWRDSKIVNISCGGALLEASNLFMENTLLFINLPLKDLSLPHLIIVQVRYCYEWKANKFRIGVKFIINEEKMNHFDKKAINCLPPAVLEYSKILQKEVNDNLQAKLME